MQYKFSLWIVLCFLQNKKEYRNVLLFERWHFSDAKRACTSNAVSCLQDGGLEVQIQWCRQRQDRLDDLPHTKLVDPATTIQLLLPHVLLGEEPFLCNLLELLCNTQAPLRIKVMHLFWLQLAWLRSKYRNALPISGKFQCWEKPTGRGCQKYVPE